MCPVQGQCCVPGRLHNFNTDKSFKDLDKGAAMQEVVLVLVALQHHAGCCQCSRDCTVPLRCCNTHPPVDLNIDEAVMFCILAGCRLPD